MPVYLCKERHMPVAVPEPVPYLGRPIRDVSGKDDHMVVRGLAGRALD